MNQSLVSVRADRAVATFWNWKSAVISAVGRSSIFLIVNLPAGMPAALAASQTEFAYRLFAAGFYGALTAWFARTYSSAAGTTAALIIVPGLAHSIEYLVHWLAGTARVGEAVAASVLVSVLTTRINLFAMQRGLLLSGPGQPSLASDFVRLFRIALDFVRVQTRRMRPWKWGRLIG